MVARYGKIIISLITPMQYSSANMERFLLALRVGVISLIGIWAFMSWSPAQFLENRLLDWNLRSYAEKTAPDPDVVILDIDEHTLEAMTPEYGRYPWSRAAFASIVEALEKQKPAAIVFDILFIDPHREHQDDDLYFINTIQNTSNTYFPMVKLDTGESEDGGFPLNRLRAAIRTANSIDGAKAALLLPMPGLRDTGRLGTINIEADQDGVIRKTSMYIEVNGWHIPSLPLSVSLGLGYSIPNVEKFSLVWLTGKSGRTHYSFYDVYRDLGRKRPSEFNEKFNNKIIVIGSTAAALGDLKLTPLGADYPGVEVLATAIDNIKNNLRLTTLPAVISPLLMVAILFTLAFSFNRNLPPTLSAAGLLITSVSLLLLSRLLLTQWLVIFYPITIILAAWLFYFVELARAYRTEQLRRQNITNTFSRFLDPRVVKQLVENKNVSSIYEGEKLNITVLFTDIRGFTTLAEQQSPRETVDMLNRYFEQQVEVIFRHGGTLDKYIGDAIMAFWGAPTAQPDHAQRAVQAARDMEQALLEFRKQLPSGGSEFDIGIGIHTGEAVVGLIGSPVHRQDYTVVGDTVNIASRIEGQTRDRCRILVSDVTRRACENNIEFVDHGSVLLKGRREEIRIFEPTWS